MNQEVRHSLLSRSKKQQIRKVTMLRDRATILSVMMIIGFASSLHAVAQTAKVMSVVPTGMLTEAQEPQAAVSAAGTIFVTYGVKNAIYCSVSTDGGHKFAVPVKAVEAGVLSLGMRRGPRIAVAGKTVVISAVYAKQGGGRDGDLLSWRSQDSGKSWQGPSKVNDIAGASREGLHAMASSTAGALACVWLDLRSKGTKIYAAFSQNGGETWSTNRLVYRSPDGTVCECCHPSVAYDGQGRLTVMWRNWLGGSRDMYLTHSEDGGKTFSAAQKLGTGTWPLKGCPMDGGSVAIDAKGETTTFWRREGSMFTCSPGSSERRIGEGEQGWAAAAANGVYLIWLERRGGNLMAEAPGQSAFTLASSANDPVVASASNGKGTIIVVWKTDNEGEAGIKAAILSGDPR